VQPTSPKTAEQARLALDQRAANERAEHGIDHVVIGGCAVAAFARQFGETVFSDDLDPLAALVMVGVRPDGSKELVAVEDGYRESEEAWASLLRNLKKRGMRAPVLPVGDGALGFWKAKRNVWPETREQRCWFHKLGSILDKLPERMQAKAKEMLHAIIYADTRTDATKAIAAFSDEHKATHPKAVTCLEDHQEALLAFFDFPAEHWKHLRTTNPIESSFSTVRLRTRVTKGAHDSPCGGARACAP
jgi:putative transposase